MTDTPLPTDSASALLADIVERGGSMGRTFDVREREDGAWDVVLLLDGGYSDREEAEQSLRIEVEGFARAYIAEVEAGRIQPASADALARIGLSITPKP